MNIKLFFTTFGTIFLMELGDKTQIATLGFASGQSSAGNGLTIFLGSAAALVLSSLIAVLCGQIVNRYIDPRLMNRITGAFLVAIGLVMIIWKRG